MSGSSSQQDIDLVEQDLSLQENGEQLHRIDKKHAYGHLPLPLRMIVHYHYTASIREKLTLILMAIFIFLMFIFASLYFSELGSNTSHSGGTIVSSSSSSDKPVAPSNEMTTCLTSECVQTSARVLSWMDRSVDPCEDFYSFSCGNWMKTHVVPNDKGRLTMFNTLSDNLKLVLREFLERERTPDTVGNLDLEILYDHARALYATCIDEKRIEEQGIKPLVRLLNELLDLFPYSRNESQQVDVNDLTEAVVYLHKKGIYPLFSVSVGADEKDPSKQILTLRQGGLTLPNKANYEDKSMVTKASKIIKDSFSLFLRYNGKEFKYSEVKEHWHHFRYVSTRVMDMETLLAGVSLDSELLEDPEKTYNPMDIQQLQESSPFLNWTLYFEKLLPKSEMVTGMRFLVEAPEFFESIEKSVIKKSGSVALRYYLIWNMLNEYSEHLSKRYRKTAMDMNKLLSGKSEFPERWKKCVEFVSDNAEWLLGRAYVDLEFPAESKKASMDIVKQIKAAFSERIRQSSWLSASTREKALEKESKIEMRIGFPDYIMNVTFLSNYYSTLEIDLTDYFANYLNTEEFYTRHKYNKLITNTEPLWSMSPQTVNAYYKNSKNEIVIPAAILQPPFYDQYAPIYMKLGSLGFVAGHEMTHGFDNHGRKFDSNGFMKSWWSSEDQKNFEKLSKCFIDQYGSQQLHLGNGTFNVSGTLTLAENLADDGGSKLSWDTWKSTSKASNQQIFKLPGLDYSPDQLFYVSFAQFWCGKLRPEEAKKRLKTDVHSPPQVRVNQIVSNSHSFAEAFKCASSRKMNPLNKCYLW